MERNKKIIFFVLMPILTFITGYLIAKSTLDFVYFLIGIIVLLLFMIVSIVFFIFKYDSEKEQFTESMQKQIHGYISDEMKIMFEVEMNTQIKGALSSFFYDDEKGKKALVLFNMIELNKELENIDRKKLNILIELLNVCYNNKSKH